MVVSAISGWNRKPPKCLKTPKFTNIRKLSDGGGLQLWIIPSGSKLWRLDHRYGGKRKGLALGSHPLLSLQAAREKAREERAALAREEDPSNRKKLRKLAAIAAAENSYQRPCRRRAGCSLARAAAPTQSGACSLIAGWMKNRLPHWQPQSSEIFESPHPLQTRRYRQDQVLHIVGERIAHSGLHRVRAGTDGFRHHVARGINHISVIAEAARHAVIASTSIQHIGGAIAGEAVGQRVAGSVDRRRPAKYQILDIGGKRVARRRRDRVDAAICAGQPAHRQ